MSSPKEEELVGTVTPAPALAADEAVQSILAQGCFHLKSAQIGQRVKEQGAIPVISEKGLEFCRVNVLEDPFIQHVLKSLDAWSVPRIGRRFSSDPGHYFSFMISSEDQVRSFVVQLWGAGSRMEFIEGSHRHRLNGVDAANGLFEVPYAQLKKLGKPIEVQMEEGGLTILDARVGFRIIEGSATTFGFTRGRDFENWAKVAQK